MELFIPSKRIVSLISTLEPIPMWEVYRRMDSKEREEQLLSSFVVGLVSRIAHNYGLDFFENRLDGTSIWNVAGEGLRNCLIHGPKEKDILFGLFLGNVGVCYGFQDGGDYFKREEIKQQYESKIPVTNSDLAGRDPNRIHGRGVNRYIFPFSDIIEVDTKTGTLYCVQLKDRLFI